MSTVAKAVVALTAVLWLILVASVWDDPLSIIGVVLVPLGAVAVVVLTVVIDAAVESARRLRRHS